MVSGRTGSGKSLLVTQLSQHFNCKLVRIHPGRVLAAGNQHHGLKRQLSQLTADPTIVWLVDVELFRGLYGAVVAEFLQNIRPNCVVIMTTRHPDKVGINIRHLCTDHIRLLPPGNNERQHLAQWLTNGRIPQDMLDVIVEETRGKTVAELFATISDRVEFQSTDAVRWRDSTNMSRDKAAQTSSKVSWGDIGGLESVIEELQESIVWPLRFREQFHRLGIRPPRGILLYGPPGTGKTMLAKAAASEVSANFIPVAIPDLIKGEIGESEKSLAQVFETAKRSPSIVFLDEIEAIFGSRESSGEVGKKLITQLFLEMDSIPEHANVIVLAATNQLHLIDPSILRPGRLDKRIHIPVPDEPSRRDILCKVTRHLNIENADAIFDSLAKIEMPGAEIKALVKYACYSAIRRRSKTLTKDDFNTALAKYSNKTVC
ncbi:P-loop containing nucleoside triphosphate hydrolase protein [Coemansia mojavensis]|nr:P-loop containing nucleoside triphosphate hydrolase protein [Coemansia mojavensis]